VVVEALLASEQVFPIWLSKKLGLLVVEVAGELVVVGRRGNAVHDSTGHRWCC